MSFLSLVMYRNQIFLKLKLRKKISKASNCNKKKIYILDRRTKRMRRKPDKLKKKIMKRETNMSLKNM